jgi:catechol 2,3-dioxygenase-like lactoylglutathione lyase family enzyme
MNASQPTPVARRAPGVTGLARTILYVKDWEASLRFYTQVLGIPPAAPPDPGWAELAPGGGSLCLHEGRASDLPTAGVCAVGLAVEDFDAARAALEADGVELGPTSSPCEGVRIAEFRDPSGNALYLEGR